MADKHPYNKRRKFILKDIVLDDFVQRQLKDTQYITRLVTRYLKCLGARIVTARGQMTADPRHHWGTHVVDESVCGVVLWGRPRAVCGFAGWIGK